MKETFPRLCDKRYLETINFKLIPQKRPVWQCLFRLYYIRLDFLK